MNSTAQSTSETSRETTLSADGSTTELLWDLTRAYHQAQEEHEVILVVPDGVTFANLKGFRVIERGQPPVAKMVLRIGNSLPSD